MKSKTILGADSATKNAADYSRDTRKGRRAITQSCIAANFARAANYTAARATIAESRTDRLMSMP